MPSSKPTEPNPERPWLVISHYSGVDGLACSHHIDDRIQALLDQSINLVVLSGISRDAIPESRNLIRYHICSPTASGIYAQIGYWLSRKIRKRPRLCLVLQALVSLPLLPFLRLESLLRLRSSSSWGLSATLLAMFVVRKHRPRIVYTSGGSSSAHFSGYAVARLFRIPWIAELQDPLVCRDPDASHKGSWRDNVLEKMICRYATGIILLTKGSQQSLGQRHSIVGKTAAIYPWTRSMSPCESEKKSDNSILTFLYAGSLKGTRNLDGFLEAMEVFLARRTDACGKISLILCGQVQRAIGRRLEACRLPIPITRLGKIPRSECALLLNAADVLLVIQHSDPISFQTIPSKLYEYLPVGKTILGLSFRNAEMEQLLSIYGHRVAQVDDVFEISEEIGKIYDDWLSGNLAVKHDVDLPTSENAGAELVKFVESLSPIAVDREPVG